MEISVKSYLVHYATNIIKELSSASIVAAKIKDDNNPDEYQTNIDLEGIPYYKLDLIDNIIIEYLRSQNVSNFKTPQEGYQHKLKLLLSHIESNVSEVMDLEDDNHA